MTIFEENPRRQRPSQTLQKRTSIGVEQVTQRSHLRDAPKALAPQANLCYEAKAAASPRSRSPRRPGAARRPQACSCPSQPGAGWDRQERVGRTRGSVVVHSSSSCVPSVAVVVALCTHTSQIVTSPSAGGYGERPERVKARFNRCCGRVSSERWNVGESWKERCQVSSRPVR